MSVCVWVWESEKTERHVRWSWSEASESGPRLQTSRCWNHLLKSAKLIQNSPALASTNSEEYTVRVQCTDVWVTVLLCFTHHTLSVLSLFCSPIFVRVISIVRALHSRSLYREVFLASFFIALCALISLRCCSRFATHCIGLRRHLISQRPLLRATTTFWRSRQDSNLCGETPIDFEDGWTRERENTKCMMSEAEENRDAQLCSSISSRSDHFFSERVQHFGGVDSDHDCTNLLGGQLNESLIAVARSTGGTCCWVELPPTATFTKLARPTRDPARSTCSSTCSLDLIGYLLSRPARSSCASRSSKQDLKPAVWNSLDLYI